MLDQCMGWVWYLANDMQFFIVSPILVFLYCKNRRVAYILAITLVVISMAINGALTVVFDITPVLSSKKFDAGNWMYGKPWSRMSAYFVGGIIGLSYFEFSKKDTYLELEFTTFNKFYRHLKSSGMTSFMLCLIGIGLTAAFSFPIGSFYSRCGFTMDPNENPNCWKPFPSLIFNLTSRPFFVVGVALIILPTFVGRLAIIKGFLSAEIFSVLARISYMAYLIHPIVLFWYIFDQRQGAYVNNLNQWFFAIGSTVMTYFFSLIFSLFCEAPFMNLEKFVLFPARKSEERNGSVSEHESKLNGKSKYHTLAEDEETLPSMKKNLTG